MASYVFDGTMTGLLSCVFRAFQFKEFDIQIMTAEHMQTGLFDALVVVESNEEHAQRVWNALKQKV